MSSSDSIFKAPVSAPASTSIRPGARLARRSVLLGACLGLCAGIAGCASVRVGSPPPKTPPPPSVDDLARMRAHDLVVTLRQRISQQPPGQQPKLPAGVSEALSAQAATFTAPPPDPNVSTTAPAADSRPLIAEVPATWPAAFEFSAASLTGALPTVSVNAAVAIASLAASHRAIATLTKPETRRDLAAVPEPLLRGADQDAVSAWFQTSDRAIQRWTVLAARADDRSKALYRSMLDDRLRLDQAMRHAARTASLSAPDVGIEAEPMAAGSPHAQATQVEHECAAADVRLIGSVTPPQRSAATALAAWTAGRIFELGGTVVALPGHTTTAPGAPTQGVTPAPSKPAPTRTAAPLSTKAATPTK